MTWDQTPHGDWIAGLCDRLPTMYRVTPCYNNLAGSKWVIKQWDRWWRFHRDCSDTPPLFDTAADAMAYVDDLIVNDKFRRYMLSQEA